jgi:pimeloyl-ACP methyl ester carboxylesterase
MQALLIHGAGGGGWEWNVWRRVLAAAGVASTAVDLQPHRDGLLATRWSDYVAQVVDAAGGLSAPRVLVGASLGGLLALAAAPLVQPEAIVLINPLPPAPESALMPEQARRPARIPWRRDASLAGTRRALDDADEAASRYAFRRWRDESGLVLDVAAGGLKLPQPPCRCLVVASAGDCDVPIAVSRALALRLDAQWIEIEGSHVGPLLGRAAAQHARRIARWLSEG